MLFVWSQTGLALQQSSWTKRLCIVGPFDGIFVAQSLNLLLLFCFHHFLLKFSAELVSYNEL